MNLERGSKGTRSHSRPESLVHVDGFLQVYKLKKIEKSQDWRALPDGEGSTACWRGEHCLLESTV